MIFNNDSQIHQYNGGTTVIYMEESASKDNTGFLSNNQSPYALHNRTNETLLEA
jgi:hypothetical protein